MKKIQTWVYNLIIRTFFITLGFAEKKLQLPLQTKRLNVNLELPENSEF